MDMAEFERQRAAGAAAEAAVHERRVAAAALRTRAAGEAAFAAAKQARVVLAMASCGEGRTNVIELSADVLALIIAKLPFSRKMIDKAPTCRAISIAVRYALRARQFSSEVVTLAEHTDDVMCVAAAPDGRVITGSSGEVKVWRDGACERTIQAHTGFDGGVKALAVLPGGARFVTGSFDDKTVKLWTLDGALERTFEIGTVVLCVAALPDGVHFVVGLFHPYEVRLYHVDGTLVHTFKGHTNTCLLYTSPSPRD